MAGSHAKLILDAKHGDVNDVGDVDGVCDDNEMRLLMLYLHRYNKAFRRVHRGLADGDGGMLTLKKC